MRDINTEIRLSPKQQRAMHQVFATQLPASSQVFLYGSRTRLSAAGGDIDLLVHVPVGTDPLLSIRLTDALHEALGEQKIDILLTEQLNAPFIQSVLPDSVSLYP
jgi:predicted nucleotidyltransferase